MTPDLPPPPPPVRHRVASMVFLVLDVIGLLCLLDCFTIVTGKFRLIFDDLLEGRNLPVLTQLILSIPRTVSFLFFVGAIAALIYKESRITDKPRTLVMNIVVFVVGIILFMVLAVGLFQPLIGIVGGVGK